jgi:hypothetical protein
MGLSDAILARLETRPSDAKAEIPSERRHR